MLEDAVVKDPGASRNGMEPLVTLHHFVHPQWFEELGGFAKEENIDLFLDWVRLAFLCAPPLYQSFFPLIAPVPVEALPAPDAAELLPQSISFLVKLKNDYSPTHRLELSIRSMPLGFSVNGSPLSPDDVDPASAPYKDTAIRCHVLTIS